MMKFTNVTFRSTTYTESGSIYEPNCNGIGFLNIGNDIVAVSGNPLQPGQGWEPPNQFPGMLDETMWDAKFYGVGNKPLLLVTRLIVASNAVL